MLRMPAGVRPSALAPHLNAFTLRDPTIVDFKYVDGVRYGVQRVGVKIEKVIERDGEVFYEGNEAGLDPPT